MPRELKHPVTVQFLKDLEQSIPRYIKAIGSFQHENETWTLIKHYTAKRGLSCQIVGCGHTPIKDIYVIRDSHGTELKIGNICITKISNQKIGKWFADYKRKSQNIRKNRAMIEIVDGIIRSYDCRDIREHDAVRRCVSWQGIERLQKMLERMRIGLNPNPKTELLARYYIKRIVQAMKAQTP